MRPSSQQSTPAIGSDLLSRNASRAIAGPSMVLGSTVAPEMYSHSHFGSAVWNRWIRNWVLIDLKRYSRYTRIPVAISSSNGLSMKYPFPHAFFVGHGDAPRGVAQQR